MTDAGSETSPEGHERFEVKPINVDLHDRAK
jgi:hypothetical protein